MERKDPGCGEATQWEDDSPGYQDDPLPLFAPKGEECWEARSDDEEEVKRAKRVLRAD